jgi:MFS family permease
MRAAPPPAPAAVAGVAPGLWRHTGFRRLWVGQTVSLFGSQVTELALPLTAALTLQATPAQMGILGALAATPWPLLGLLAGVWVDRLPRRPILILSDLARAALLLLVPLAALLGRLSLELLYVVAFCAGALSVFFEVAYNAILPALVGRARLLDANSRLQASVSVAETAGPGLAGALAQAITPPLAVLLDVVSFCVSAGFVWTITAPEPRAAGGRSAVHEIREGLAAVLRDPVLRALVVASTSCNLFLAMNGAARVIYATRTLHLSPATVGLVFAVGGLGGLPATLLAGRAARRWGVGPTIIATQFGLAAGAGLFPLAGGPPLVAAAVLAAGMALIAAAAVIYVINVGSLRQALTPDRLQGRVAATARFVSRSALPVGFLLGGLLGERFGLLTPLVVPGVGLAVMALWLLASPVRAVHAPPTSAEPPLDGAGRVRGK